MEKAEEKKPLARCPRWDRWDTRIASVEEQLRLIALYRQSGAKSKSDFVRGQLFREDFKVVVVREADDEYYRKLSELTAQVHRVGVLCNQAVRSIHMHNSVKIASTLTARLEEYSEGIHSLLQQAVVLTEEYRSQG